MDFMLKDECRIRDGFRKWARRIKDELEEERDLPQNTPGHQVKQLEMKSANEVAEKIGGTGVLCRLIACLNMLFLNL